MERNRGSKETMQRIRCIGVSSGSQPAKYFEASCGSRVYVHSMNPEKKTTINSIQDLATTRKCLSRGGCESESNFVTSLLKKKLGAFRPRPPPLRHKCSRSNAAKSSSSDTQGESVGKLTNRIVLRNRRGRGTKCWVSNVPFLEFQFGTEKGAIRQASNQGDHHGSAIGSSSASPSKLRNISTLGTPHRDQETRPSGVFPYSFVLVHFQSGLKGGERAGCGLQQTLRRCMGGGGGISRERDGVREPCLRE